MTERAPVEIRSAAVQAVDYPARTIELLAVPYDTWATVDVGGRLIEEAFAPGAFGRVAGRNQRERFTVNLEHDPQRWVGRVAALDTAHQAGLRAELLIRRGAEFDQILDDAADGMYAGSVGFAANSADQQWDAARTRRRIVKAYLDHIALTTTPAFQGADVLAVRTAPEVNHSSTPNLDRILSERQLARYRSA